MDIQTANLLRVAAQDETALLLPGMPDIPFGQHVQAAIEKLLKALINEHGQHYPRTHDLEKLNTIITSLGDILPVLPVALADLADYAMDFRYGEGIPPQPLNRQDCQDAVRLVREYVTARIQALGQPPPPAPAPTQP